MTPYNQFPVQNVDYILSDLAMLQEEECDWDFCDVGCPVEAGMNYSPADTR